MRSSRARSARPRASTIWVKRGTRGRDCRSCSPCGPFAATCSPRGRTTTPRSCRHRITARSTTTTSCAFPTRSTNARCGDSSTSQPCDKLRVTSGRRRTFVLLADVLDRAAAGGRISFDEGVRLYRDASLHDLGAAAHARRMAMYPTNDVTYVVDTTINYTNVCNVHCTFCAFFRPEQHGEGYTMSHDKVIERVRYAADMGATQIMIQGGVNPELRIEWFEDLFRRVAAEFPGVDIHSLSVSEIAGLAKVEDLSV